MIEVSPMNYPELSYDFKVNKYGADVNIHCIPVEAFRKLPGYCRSNGIVKWKNVRIDGISITYFQEQ